VRTLIVSATPTLAAFVRGGYRPVAAAAQLILSCRTGAAIHPSTVTRWIVRGVRLRDGRVLKLEARRFPGGWGVTDEAIERFLEALTADRSGGPVPVSAPRTISPAQ
jgi:hypothetical protein